MMKLRGFYLCIAIIMGVARVSFGEVELMGDEKQEILDRIRDKTISRPSLALDYTLQQEMQDEPIKNDYFLVMDDHRSYLKGVKALRSESELAAAPTLNNNIIERSWNGVLYCTFDHEGQNGWIDAKRQLCSFMQIPQYMIGTIDDGTTWAERLNDGTRTFNVYHNQEKGIYTIDELTQNGVEFYTKYSFTFSEQHNLEIMHVSVSIIDERESVPSVQLIMEIQFENFKEIDGYYVPFAATKRAFLQSSELVSQSVSVNNVSVNQPEHEEYLKGFNYPKGALVFDRILNESIQIGMQEDVIGRALDSLVLQANKELSSNSSIGSTIPNGEGLAQGANDIPDQINALWVYIFVGACVAGIALIFMWKLVRGKKHA